MKNKDDISYFYNNANKCREILDEDYKFLSPGEENSSPQLDVKLNKQSKDDIYTNQKVNLHISHKSTIELKVSRVKSGFKEDLTNFHDNTQNKDNSNNEVADNSDRINDTIRSFK